MIEEKSLIKGKNEKYERYQKLLLKRDSLKREAGSIMTAYIKAFGKLLTDAFELKIKCISLKKSITFCQTAVNRGELPDKSKLDRYIEESMEEYRAQLEEMIEAHEEAISAKTFSDNTIQQCKTLYKRIAKTIHPDLHPNLSGDDAINELWNRSVEAYHISDLKALKELVVLVEAAANEYDPAELSVEIPDIDERIKDVEEEIEEIKNTKPYSFKYILEDVIRYDEKKTEIEQEIEYYSSYAKELEQILSAYDFKEGKPCLLS